MITCDDLNACVEHYTKQLGYRLDMIKPADAPCEALMSKGRESVRLVLSSNFSWPLRGEEPTEIGTQNEWVRGRAGMEYRDLIPGRLGGRIIASHIRIRDGGEVADYVHYHKVEFQVIYCKAGSIKVVYEDQGGPFWLNPGDCVLQPPEIRHRVLECTANSEVIEIGVPAVHETWIEHDITLPTAASNSERVFCGQSFVRHIAEDAVWKQSEYDEFEVRETGISAATGGLANVCVYRTSGARREAASRFIHCGEFLFFFVIKGELLLSANERDVQLNLGDSCLVPAGFDYSFKPSVDLELLRVLYSGSLNARKPPI